MRMSRHRSGIKDSSDPPTISIKLEIPHLVLLSLFRGFPLQIRAHTVPALIYMLVAVAESSMRLFTRTVG